MKSYPRFTKRNWLIAGAVVGLCFFCGSWFLWQRWHAPSIIKAPNGDLYTKITTNRGVSYEKLPTPEGAMHAEKSFQYSRERNWPAAVEEARQAVRADPNNRQFQWQLGFTLQRAGQTKEAVAVLRELSQQRDAVGQSSAIKSAAVILRKIEQNPNWGQPKR